MEEKSLLRNKTIFELHNSGLSPKKEKGQHFLIDSFYIDRIIEAANISPSDNILEIGPGTGNLTSELCKTGAYILAIEKDSSMIPHLNKKLKIYDNVNIVEGDIRRIDMVDILNEKPGIWKVVANLPYYITNYMIVSLLENKKLFERILLTIQLEVAERLTASPGSKIYGAITLFADYHSSMEIIEKLPPEAFFPIPKVHSSIIRILPRQSPPVVLRNEEKFFKLIRSAFNMRRKTLRNAIMRSTLSEWSPEIIDIALKDSGIDGQRRGETLSIEEFALLANLLP
jgi:16S rRNA (adenine1518-N6/adenine1519-N6)-dimethyltransferase